MLRLLRTARRLTVEALAERTERLGQPVSVGRIRQMESESRPFRLPRKLRKDFLAIEAVARALDVDLVDLLACFGDREIEQSAFAPSLAEIRNRRGSHRLIPSNAPQFGIPEATSGDVPPMFRILLGEADEWNQTGAVQQTLLDPWRDEQLKIWREVVEWAAANDAKLAARLESWTPSESVGLSRDETGWNVFLQPRRVHITRN